MSEGNVESLNLGVGGPHGGSDGAPSAGLPAPASPAQRAWRRFRKNRPALFSAGFLMVLLIIVVAWPIALKIANGAGAGSAAWAKAHAPEKLSDAQFQPPTAQHWFGTDDHGRDVLSRVLYGAQISLLVGFVGAVVSLVIGVFWGSIAGSAGGRVDSIMMRTVDVLYSLPSIIFVIVLMTTLGEKLKQLPVVRNSPTLGKEMRLLILFIGLGAISWLTMARIVRGQVLSLRTRPFVDASRALGASPLRILARHIIPNVFSVVIVYLTLTVPSIVLYESFLSFLGLGVQPPMASWGSLISEGVNQINPIRIYWWMIVFPGGVLVSTLLALNFLGDGLRDAWDVNG